jgi:prolyl-tRNA editing enzyme YbaK/EbsC (Cys-tRNA(Pro) deacylase)
LRCAALNFIRCPKACSASRACCRTPAIPIRRVMLDDACRTAQQAADALGISVGQIAKSIIFRRKSDDVAVLVITSGDKRVDEKKVDAMSARPAAPTPSS